MPDRDTGRATRFALVEMTNASAADKAIAALNGTELGGRRLIVSEAKPKSPRPGKSGRASAAEADVGAMTIAGTHVNLANRAGNNQL